MTVIPFKPTAARVVARECPPWCIQHAGKPTNLRFTDPSVTHYSRTYFGPVVFDGDVTTFNLCLYRFDEDPAAGKVGDAIVYTNFRDGKDMPHGIDMTMEQARSMYRFLGAMLTVVTRERELTEFADDLADLAALMKGKTPAEEEQIAARMGDLVDMEEAAAARAAAELANPRTDKQAEVQ